MRYLREAFILVFRDDSKLRPHFVRKNESIIFLDSFELDSEKQALRGVRDRTVEYLARTD